MPGDCLRASLSLDLRNLTCGQKRGEMQLQVPSMFGESCINWQSKCPSKQHAYPSTNWCMISSINSSKPQCCRGGNSLDEVRSATLSEWSTSSPTKIIIFCGTDAGWPHIRHHFANVLWGIVPRLLWAFHPRIEFFQRIEISKLFPVGPKGPMVTFRLCWFVSFQGQRIGRQSGGAISRPDPHKCFPN